MISTFVHGKTIICIDASNIYHSQKRLGWRIDFQKLLVYFAREAELHRCYFYTAYDPTSDKQRRFLDFLDLIGYTVRTKKVKFIRDQLRDEGGFHKGNLDVELTIDAVHTLLDYQSFILLSGDSDFAFLLKFLKAHGKRCVVMSTKGSVALDLVQQAKFIDLKKLRNEFELMK
ncbi:MAG: NYN domain-containing protein [Patescibacteria group bacterium]